MDQLLLESPEYLGAEIGPNVLSYQAAVAKLYS